MRVPEAQQKSIDPSNDLLIASRGIINTTILPRSRSCQHLHKDIKHPFANTYLQPDTFASRSLCQPRRSRNLSLYLSEIVNKAKRWRILSATRNKWKSVEREEDLLTAVERSLTRSIGFRNPNTAVPKRRE